MIEPDALDARERRKSVLSIHGAFGGLGLVAWWAGLPFPNHDDSFFFGAPYHLMQTGELANPWITGWMSWVPSAHLDRYYVQPPFHPWAIAIWLRLFGLSALTVTAYAMTTTTVAAAAAGCLLKQLGSATRDALLGGLVVFALLIQRGLRPESLGLALLLPGQLALLRRTSMSWFNGCLLTGAGVFCHLFLAVIAVPALLLHLADRVRGESPKARWRAVVSRVVIGSGALLVLLGLLAILVHGEWSAFWHDIRAHAAFVTPSAGTRLTRFLRIVNVGKEVFPNLLVIFSTLALGVASFWLQPRARYAIVTGGGAWCLMIALGYLLYAPFVVAFMVVGAAWLAVNWRRSLLPGMVRRLLAVPAVGVVAWASLEVTAQAWANAHAPTPDRAAIRAYLEATQPDIVLFDLHGLRYALDFAPPARSTECNWAAPGAARRYWSISDAQPRDVWVVHPLRLPASLADQAPSAHLELLGHKFHALIPLNAVVVVRGTALPSPERDLGVPVISLRGIEKSQ